jgi:Pyruvate/2-oxoacid:ferredoxin oxidoreductase delta subunit
MLIVNLRIGLVYKWTNKTTQQMWLYLLRYCRPVHPVASYSLNLSTHIFAIYRWFLSPNFSYLIWFSSFSTHIHTHTHSQRAHRKWIVHNNNNKQVKQTNCTKKWVYCTIKTLHKLECTLLKLNYKQNSKTNYKRYIHSVPKNIPCERMN